MASGKQNYYDVISEAIADLSESGFTSAERVAYWQRKIREAAEGFLGSAAQMEEALRDALAASYKRMVDSGKIAKFHPGVARWTLEKVRPTLRAELDRRIMASANLIRLNREQAIAKTLQRFSGWSTSIPPGGSSETNKREEAARVRKPLASLKFEERRVLIDQGAKLVSSLNSIVAVDGGAIAAKWRSHWKQAGYRYRESHRERDEKIYTVRGSWALEKGLIKKSPHGYTDEITQPAEEPYCLPGDTSVDFFNDVEKGYRRFYSGPLVTITLASGRRFSATPNHPVLTPNGWASIGSLKKGENIVEIADESIEAAKLNTDETFSTISNLFNAMRFRGFEEVRSGMKPQFHGDGTEENVDVVSLAGPLFDWSIATRYQRIKDFIFTATYFLRLARRSFFEGIHRFFSPTNSVMGFSTSNGPMLSHAFGQRTEGLFGNAEPFHNCRSGDAEGFSEFATRFTSVVATTKFHNIEKNFVNSAAAGSKIDPLLFVPVPDCHSGNADGFRDGFNGSPLRTQLANIVDVDVRAFSGHVYNLQTESGWYVANRVITHNCRCFYTYLYSLRDMPDDMLTNKGRDTLAEARRKIQEMR